MSNYDASFAQNRHEDDKQNESNLDAEVQELYSSMDIKDVAEEEGEYIYGFTNFYIHFKIFNNSFSLRRRFLGGAVQRWI